jgi:hypothetical protein
VINECGVKIYIESCLVKVSGAIVAPSRTDYRVTGIILKNVYAYENSYSHKLFLFMKKKKNIP